MNNIQEARQYILDLYNSFSAVAERVDQQRLVEIHIGTQLDEAIRSWVDKGLDVVLTGNPGDGKTHLIEVLKQKQALSSAKIETDASQKTSQLVLHEWHDARQRKQPFILAINHAPLRALAQQADQQPELSKLKRVEEEIDKLVYYNDPSETLLPKVRIVDLSQREVLIESDKDSSIVRQFARILSQLATLEPCPDCPPRRCPVEYNAGALANGQVLDRLMTLFSLVARRGMHATMRDLAGLLAFALTGGVSCERRWEEREDENGNSHTPTFEDYAYYNLLFDEKGRSPLFDALRDFDVGHLGDPKDDLLLWNGDIEGRWLFETPPPPSNLAELRRLKRQYFFEHMTDKTDHLRRMLPLIVQKFDEILAGQFGDRDATEHLIGLINILYAPRPSDQSSDYPHRLRLWNSHRYSRGEAPGYVAMRSLPADKLMIYHPKPAPFLERAIEIKQDHVLLGVQRYCPGAPALRVDWPMYQALTAANVGRPISLQPFHILRRLDLFLRSLGQDVGGARNVESIEWSERGRRHRLPTVRVNRRRRTYEDA